MKLLQLITVDDEPHIHDGLDAIIDWKALGCVHDLKAGNGAEAYKIIVEHKPDIILTDIKMPKLDGIELIKKVRKIKDYTPAVIIMSGYNDFEYAQAALRHKVTDYLLKPIDEDELTACIAQIVSSARNLEESLNSTDSEKDKAAISAVFRRLAMQSNETDNVDVQFLNLDKRISPPFAFGLLVPFSKIDKNGQPENGGFYPDDVCRAFSALKDRMLIECIYREAGGSVGILIPGGILNPESASVELEIRGLYRTVSSKLQYESKLIVGEKVDDLGNIAFSRKSVFDCISSCYLMHAPGFSLVSALPPVKEFMVNREEILSLMKSVDNGDWSNALSYVSQFFEAIKQGFVSMNSVRDWIHVILYEVSRLVDRLDGKMPENTETLRTIGRNAELISYSEIINNVSVFVKDACCIVDELRKSVRHSNVVMIQRAIERRCADELTLSELAEELKMNPVYLGQLFKQVIGKSFKDYQRELRMKEACRLLRETNGRIIDIAAQVGYHNYDYFVEQFKREMNITPSAYRRM